MEGNSTHTSSENGANLANVDILPKLYKNSDDVRSIVDSGVMHQRHSCLVVFAKSRQRTLVTERRKHGHETSLCRYSQA